MMKSLLSTMQR